MSSMLYTMGMAINRAADLGYEVEVLIDGHWLTGHVAARPNDGVGLVMEHDDSQHSVVKMDRIAAVKIKAESPYRQEISAARPIPGPRPASS